MHEGSDEYAHTDESLPEKFEHFPVAAEQEQGQQVHFSLHEVALSEQGDERLLCAFHIVAHLMLRAAAVRTGCYQAQQQLHRTCHSTIC